MKFVRLTLEQPPSLRHPMQQFLAETDEVRAERMLGWTVPDDGDVWYLLFHVEGSLAAYRDAVESVDPVRSYDLTPVGEESFYAYVVEERRPTDEQFLRAFADRNLVMVPPVVFSSDGRATYTVVGPAGDQQRMLEALPEDFVVDVERIGEYDHRYGTLAGRLTDRQREAVVAAVEAGYYDLPRECDLDAVADELGCSTAAASKLLRRAESAVMAAVTEG